MKIRSLLLGSIAAAGLTTAGYAADLGVVTSLDVCDELGLSGLTISSDDNCLVITGNVSYEFNYGDYTDNSEVDANNEIAGGEVDFIDPSGAPIDHSSSYEAWLQFVATASSDFGNASATLKLINDSSDYVKVDAAWVGIGDTTMLMAGKKGTIFENGDDAPLNWLGLFNSSRVDAGVGGTGVANGGHVIQVVSQLGNGLSIGGGLEALNTTGTAVGVLKYAGDGLAAHASFEVGNLFAGTPSAWAAHAGLSATMDNFKFVVAGYADNTTDVGDTYYNVLASASATFDMFTIAVSGEADGSSDGRQQYGVGGSLSAAVAEGITLNLGGRYWKESDGDTVSQAAVGLTAAVTETITATAEVGYATESNGPDSLFYGKGSLAWSPGGGFTSSVALEANSNSAYQATFKAAKSIK